MPSLPAASRSVPPGGGACRRRSRRREPSPARVVRAASDCLPVATAPGSVPHPRERGHAAADPSCSCGARLPDVRSQVPHRVGAGEGGAIGRAAGVGNARLQPARRRFARGGSGHHRATRRTRPVRSRGAGAASRRGHVHGRGRALARVRDAGTRHRHERWARRSPRTARGGRSELVGDPLRGGGLDRSSGPGRVVVPEAQPARRTLPAGRAASAAGPADTTPSAASAATAEATRSIGSPVSVANAPSVELARARSTRTTAPRTCRKDPANGDCVRRGRAGADRPRRNRHPARRGQSSHFGTGPHT